MYPHCDLPIICHPHLSPNVHCSHYLTKSLKYNVNHLHCDLPMIFHPHFMPSKVQISENHLVDMLFSPSIYYQPHLSPKYKKCKFTHLIFFSEKGKYLALDLGGTNFRVLMVELNGRDVDIQSKTYLIPQRIMLGTGTQVCKVKTLLSHYPSSLTHSSHYPLAILLSPPPPHTNQWMPHMGPISMLQDFFPFGFFPCVNINKIFITNIKTYLPLM